MDDEISNKDNPNDPARRNQESSDRLEGIFLQWIFISFLLIVFGTMVYTISNKGRLFALISFGIAIFLLIITAVDYWAERNRLRKQGIKPILRTDLLLVGVIAIIILIGWIMYQIIRETYYQY